MKNRNEFNSRFQERANVFLTFRQTNLKFSSMHWNIRKTYSQNIVLLFNLMSEQMKRLKSRQKIKAWAIELGISKNQYLTFSRKKMQVPVKKYTHLLTRTFEEGQCCPPLLAT